MKLIDDLIDELTDKSASLTDVLIRTKVLAFKLKNEELKNWLDNELNGYEKGEIPPYRILPCHVIGNISNGYQRYTDYPIPLTGLDKRNREAMTTAKLYQSISALDPFVQKDSKMITNVLPEWYPSLSKYFENDFVVEYAKREIGPSQITQVLTTVRSKLLDFLLKLNEEAGNTVDINTLSQGANKEKISSIFSSAVFGNNTTIIVGDSNTQTLTNSNNIQGSIAEFKKELEKHKVPSDNIGEIIQIVQEEEPNRETKKFGVKANNWVQKMLSKTLDGTWQIGTGAAGGLLVELIKAYYGIH